MRRLAFCVALVARRPASVWSIASISALMICSPMHASASATIPAQSDWVDYGTVFENGPLGEWDYQFYGAFALSAVKKDGTYFLYYQGASGYRIADDTVTWRAIGVATSPDGINFTKHAGNPILVWYPNNEPEEGPVSAGATVAPDGDVYLYFCQNVAISSTLVNCDGRLATSSNGLDFVDQGLVLDHADTSIWGYGDDLVPIIALTEAGQWYVYYQPNGGVADPTTNRKLALASGPAPDQLTTTGPALSGGSTIPSWGSGGLGKIDVDTYALFIHDASTPGYVEARTMSLSSPDSLSAVVESYQFPEIQRATVFLDDDANTWFMYYRYSEGGHERHGVKLAPAGPPDVTPPTAPPGVSATPVDHDRVDVSWSAATDGETGIVQYEVFRDGQLVATVKGWDYTDAGLSELTTYSYEVSAVNYHGVEGPRSAPVGASTPADTTPPGLASVSASGSATEVVVTFDEPVEQASAETATNYALDHGVTVSSAVLDTNLRAVTLTTSSQHEHTTYSLTVSGISDRAAQPNAMPSPVQMQYLFSGAAGLVASWRLDEASGTTAFDTSAFDLDGTLDYPDATPAVWTTGIEGGALQFDGLDDLVTLEAEGALEDATDDSHSFAAWVRPDDTPPDTADNNTYYSVLTRSYRGLYYDPNQRFRAVVESTGSGDVGLVSAPHPPGEWHHVAMTVDEPSRQMRLYVDGVEVAGSPASFAGSLVDHEDFEYWIGTSDPLVERWDYRFKGLIDEVRVYDRVLGASEVQVLADLCDSSDPDSDADGTPDCDDACLDADGDGYGTNGPIGTCLGADCDDAASSTHPGADEANDGSDNQCPGDAGFGLIDELGPTLDFPNAPADKSSITWTAQAGATEYEVSRDDDPQFASPCTLFVETTNGTTDATVPAAGEALFYLARSSMPNAGSWGADSSDAERFPGCGP